MPKLQAKASELAVNKKRENKLKIRQKNIQINPPYFPHKFGMHTDVLQVAL